MFDDPKKELQRLQEQLLAVEAEEEEPEWEPEEEDPDQAMLDVQALLARDDWEETEREPLYMRYTREDPQPEYEIPQPPARKPAPKQNPKQKAETGRVPKSAAILVLLLEALGLGCLTAWWLLWR